MRLTPTTVEAFWDELEKVSYAYNDMDDEQARKSRRDAAALAVGTGAVGAGLAGAGWHQRQKRLALEAAEEAAARSMKGRIGAGATALGALGLAAAARVADKKLERMGNTAWSAGERRVKGAVQARKQRRLLEARMRGRAKGKVLREAKAKRQAAVDAEQARLGRAYENEAARRRAEVKRRRKAYRESLRNPHVSVSRTPSPYKHPSLKK